MPGGYALGGRGAFEEAASVARRVREPSAYQAAIGLYSGELLPEDLYEPWAEERRRELRETNLALLIELAELMRRSGKYEPAITALRLVVTDDPANQRAHGGLVRLYALAGRRDEALKQYEWLRREVGEGARLRQPASPRRDPGRPDTA